MKIRSLFAIAFLLMYGFMYAAPNYNNGNGYVSVERGGSKYYIPENMVMMDLSWF